MEIPLSDYRKMAVAEFDTTKLLAHAAQQANERGYDKLSDRRRGFASLRISNRWRDSRILDDPVLQQLMLSAGRAVARRTTACCRPASAIRTWAGA